VLDHHTDDLRIGGWAVSLERLTYATIVLMSVLVVYDGWDELASYVGVAVVILGPTLAIAAAHLFSDAVHSHAEHGRPLTLTEWRHLLIDQVQILASAIPPLLVLAVGWLSPFDENGTIALLLWTGVATLTGLAAVAGRRAGFRGWRWVIVAMSGGAVGLFVVSLQIILKPY
jgi:voltage-gated potassium channel Kch